LSQASKKPPRMEYGNGSLTVWSFPDVESSDSQVSSVDVLASSAERSVHPRSELEPSPPIQSSPSISDRFPVPSSPPSHVNLHPLQATSKAKPTTPSYFNPLIQILQEYSSEKCDAPTPSRVARGLKQRFPEVYRSAGVMNWKDYAALAETEGIITLGRIGGKARVSLRPEWQDKDPTVSVGTSLSSNPPRPVHSASPDGRHLHWVPQAPASHPAHGAPLVLSSIPATENTPPEHFHYATIHDAGPVVLMSAQDAQKGLTSIAAPTHGAQLVLSSVPATENIPPEHFHYATIHDAGPVVLMSGQDSQKGLISIPAERPRPEPPMSPSFQAIPPHFLDLLQILEGFKAAGISHPLQTSVHLTLMQQNRKVFQQAGVKSWTEYAAVAERLGLITLGVSHGFAWVSLDPFWGDKVSAIARGQQSHA